MVSTDEKLTTDQVIQLYEAQEYVYEKVRKILSVRQFGASFLAQFDTATNAA